MFLEIYTCLVFEVRNSPLSPWLAFYPNFADCIDKVSHRWPSTLKASERHKIWNITLKLYPGVKYTLFLHFPSPFYAYSYQFWDMANKLPILPTKCTVLALFSEVDDFRGLKWPQNGRKVYASTLETVLNFQTWSIQTLNEFKVLGHLWPNRPQRVKSYMSRLTAISPIMSGSRAMAPQRVGV